MTDELDDMMAAMGTARMDGDADAMVDAHEDGSGETGGVSNASGDTDTIGDIDPADNPHALFPGDTSTMDAEARAVAIALKRDRFITGDAYETALDHVDEVRRSLNDDLLELVDVPRYQVMYARPVTADGLGQRSLKTRASLTREEAAMLALLRIRVLGYESSRESSKDWIISTDDIRAALTTGAGWLAARNDEEGVMKRIGIAISRCVTYGYLAPVEDTDDMYRITPLVPAVLTTELAEQWLGESENSTAGSADDPEEDVQITVNTDTSDIADATYTNTADGLNAGATAAQTGEETRL
ncbi:DUF4194 domain-containing protein [Bifidobacterium sp.]|uniref:DUF4194 domain-containing protein n=1 Tax=Bifidobacterium sp. TaxID=41200 RepID=UPI002A91D595|nr:DUF4194 domain-containing protein [Bifidobacterium sp.]MDY5368055.1 DUF4194 domain-containing protein [Bifidobacterium sp.]